VLADGERPQGHYVPSIDALGSVAGDAAALAVDIPIGLPTEGARHADLLARAFVGPLRNSVFLTPVREAMRHSRTPQPHEPQLRRREWASASRRTGWRGSSSKSSDGCPGYPCPIYEVHPEVSFTVLLQHPARPRVLGRAGRVLERVQELVGGDGRASACSRGRRDLPGRHRRRRGGAGRRRRRAGRSGRRLVRSTDRPRPRSFLPGPSGGQPNWPPGRDLGVAARPRRSHPHDTSGSGNGGSAPGGRVTRTRPAGSVTSKVASGDNFPFQPGRWSR
jgi:hypothetical protein